MALFRHYWHPGFFAELLLLVVTAPIFYMSGRFGPLVIAAASAVLAGGWVWRKVQTGVWLRRTPADWPLLLLIGVMLPVAVWAAPEPLRGQYAWPRALVLLWDVQLFVVVVTYVSAYRRLTVPTVAILVGIALLIALLAPFGTNWLFKLPGTEAVLSRLPAVLRNFSREGGSGFHPNVIAGALLYVLPLLIALVTANLRRARRGPAQWLLIAVTLYMLTLFALLQSRGGYLGLAAALITMPAIHFRWGRRLLIVGAVAALMLLITQGHALLGLLADNPGVEAVGGVTTLANFRVNLWATAVEVIRDYPFTGVGLGAFQVVASVFYPLDVPRDFYFGHAHNFWLQGAIDFGIPGLAALLAICLAAAVQLRGCLPTGDGAKPLPVEPLPVEPLPAGLVTGLVGSLAAQLVFSLTDSLSLGTTVNLLFWLLLGLIFALGNLAAAPPDAPERAEW